MKDPPVNLAMALNWGQEHELRSAWVDLSDLIFFSKRRLLQKSPSAIIGFRF